MSLVIELEEKLFSGKYLTPLVLQRYFNSSVSDKQQIYPFDTIHVKFTPILLPRGPWFPHVSDQGDYFRGTIWFEVFKSCR